MPLGPNGEPIRAEHILIAGDSGAGKDTLGRWVVDKSDVPTLTAYDNTYPGHTVSSMESLQERVDGGKDTVVDMGSGYDTASAMVGMAASNGPINLCFPESSNFLFKPDEDPAKQNNPVWWALTEGRDKGIKVIMTEQDPSDLPYTPLKQVPWIAWTGAPAGFSKGFFNHPIGNWMNEDDLPVRDHRYVVFHKSGFKVFPKDGTAETPKSHA